MNSNGNGPSLMDVVLRFFQEEQWNYQKIDNKSALRAGFRGERGTWICHVQVDEINKRFLFYSLMGMFIPQQYRGAVLEYLSRINSTLQVGNFEMDFETGDVRFRTSVETPDGELSLSLVRSLAYINVHTIDHYFPGVMAVIHGGLSPEAALARVETQSFENVLD
jgi:hypothetical protein